MSTLSAKHLAMLQDRAVRGGVPDCWIQPVVRLISDLRSAREEIRELRKRARKLKRENKKLLAELAKEHALTRKEKAAAVRVRRAVALGDKCPFSFGATGNVVEAAEFLRDLGALVSAYLAEHPADDEEPVTLEELKAAAQACDVQLTVFEDGTVEVYGTVKPEPRGQLRALLKGLGR